MSLLPIVKQGLLLAIISLTSFSLPESRTVNIVFIGDSITEGNGLPDPSTEATPLLAGQIFREHNKHISAQVANRGFNGHTTVDVLPVTQTDFPQILETANAFAQDKTATLLFSIMLGTNDSANSGTNGAPVSAADYKKNLKTIIDALLTHFPNARFVLQFPIWYSPNTHNGASYLQEGLSRLESYYPQIDALVLDYKASHQHQVFAGDKSGFAIFKSRCKELLKPEPGKDGVFYLHPNALGSHELARIWVKGIDQAIR